MTASAGSVPRSVWVGLLITGLALGALWICTALGQGSLAAIAKMTASTAFVATAVVAGGLHFGYGRTVVIALFFSWWGDFFLIKEETFLFGLIAFFLGHVFFGIAFLIYGVQPRWVIGGLIGLILFGIPVFLWLNPSLNAEAVADLKVPVYAYICVISLMCALSIGAWGRGAPIWVPVGALVFYVSDIFVAREAFVHPELLNRLVGLPLYFGAQMVFAYTVALVRKAPKAVE